MTENIDICSVVRFAVKCIETMQTRVPIIFICTKTPELSGSIVTDKQWLTDNVLCLLSNAVKFTDIGEVTVTCSFIDDTRLQRMVLVEVADSGVGVSAELKKKLFQPFQQAQQNTGECLH